MSKFEELSPDGSDWVVRELRALRAELEELRSARSGEAMSVGSGGIKITNDGYLQMVDDNGTQIMYFGPDPNGVQIARLRRENGSLMLYTGKAGSNNFWALTDNQNKIIMSDDASSGKGLARPWLPVHLMPTYMPNLPTAGVTGTWCIDSTQVVSETVLWEGRASVSHPYIHIDGVWGHATGSGTVTYRLKLAGTTVGTWTATTGEVSRRGPYSVGTSAGTDWVQVTVTAEQATGSGAVRCHIHGCYLTQTQ